MKILTARQAREIDQETCARIGIPNLLLMENAAIRLVEYAEMHLGDLRGKGILVLAGKGNNGGDGMAAARQFKMRGACPQVCLLADPTELQGDALQNYRMMIAGGGIPVLQCPESPTPAAWPESWRKQDLLLDGLLGTGTRGPASGLFAQAIEWINREFAGYVVAIDLPSGLEADCGRIPGPTVLADATITFTTPKPCHLLHPAAQCCGDLIVAPIGTPASLLQKEEFFLDLFDAGMTSPALESRSPAAHKGQFGRVLVIAGGRGKTGAAALAGLGALKAGAGLVTLAVPRSCQNLAAGFAPELMTEALPETSDGTFSATGAEQALCLAANADVLAIGPGIGQHPETGRFFQQVLDGSRLPVVIDADALNLIAGGHLQLPKSADRIAVLTPHPGEMARLAGCSTEAVQLDRISYARSYAQKHDLFLVLKGAGTLTASPGGSVFINNTGNAGMATAGSGDVLTGMIAAMLAQQAVRESRPMIRQEVAVAAATAVFLHGLSGDCAAEAASQMTLVATDLLRYLPKAIECRREASDYIPGGSIRLRRDPRRERAGRRFDGQNRVW